ncbi:hypothetical protein RH831_00615 [Halodesulfurarchaeum sp. HSR-GB]|uniref:hypothetical protein n=1 Tax=Halodesulfurarchaeum sp. HSR-GB TaxID=3074077 RepID=UPI00285AC5D7|nr:hypothetical protein [Halodesulfurarchaeum sp. HSR-GB]MDR5655685.1 hypothetical protein [Halodesulfurarchaeum sp. HSR-GB]
MRDGLDLGDDRGVSAVIGFIFIFAILMILLSVNQAQVVPAENEQIEYQHFEDVRNDLVDLRSAISTAGQNDVSQFPTVKLGTAYPPRVLAVNPPPASGTLRTSEAYNITITDETGTTVEIPTRFLEYQPGYHEFQSGPTWYENSVLYLDESQRGGIVIIEEQNLVTDDNTVRITALQNDFRRSGTGRVTVELYPTQAGDLSELTGELEIAIPTQLSGDTYWDEAFDDDVTVNPTVTPDWYESGVHALNLTVETDNLEINTVGIESEPDAGNGAKQNVGVPDSGNNGQPDEDLPIASFAYTRKGSSDQVDLDGSASQGDIDTYEWDIGDDGDVDATGQTVNKADIPPETDVRLIVTDSSGKSDSTVRNIP